MCCNLYPKHQRTRTQCSDWEIAFGPLPNKRMQLTARQF
jgi:hypothetical protein